MDTVVKACPLSECTEQDLTEHHALVYGRCRVWYVDLTDNSVARWHWSKYAWWKAMWYPHRGPPHRPGTWGLYAGSTAGGHTGPGDAEISHFLPMPGVPEGFHQTIEET